MWSMEEGLRRPVPLGCKATRGVEDLVVFLSKGEEVTVGCAGVVHGWIVGVVLHGDCKRGAQGANIGGVGVVVQPRWLFRWLGGMVVWQWVVVGVEIGDGEGGIILGLGLS